MPYTKINVSKCIEEEKKRDKDFADAWDKSRPEYKLLGEFIRLRNEQHMTQAMLAKESGSRQQVISRIEKRESNPTLKTFCRLLDILGYELRIVKKQQNG